MVGPEQIFTVCLILLVIGGGVGLLWWRGRAVGYAPFFAGWFLTWPIIGYMGAQGFTGLVAVLALPVLLFVRPKTVPLYAAVFVGFIGWVLVVAWRTQDPDGVITGSLKEGSLTMDAAGLRIALTALAATAMILAIRHVDVGRAEKSLAFIRTIGFVQGAGVMITALLMQPIIALIVEHGLSENAPGMTQNLLRNANTFLLLLPLLLAWLWQRRGRIDGRLMASGGGLLAFVAFALTGTQVALAGCIIMVICVGLIHRFPQRGFRILISTLAVYILAAPLLVKALAHLVQIVGVPIPQSFTSRIYSWELVNQKIAQSPLFGHGLEASHAWSDTYGEHPEWLAEVVAAGADERAWSVYRVMPTHPHNMALQIWAETGLLGAGLMAGTLALLGWRLRPPREWTPIVRYGAAGLIGVTATLFSFSYSMWNEAFWASVAVAGAVVLLQARQDGTEYQAGAV